ncbi:MAG: hypothetical protein K0U98_28435 [Deltaproteobacteria bacterium]|nr:hypothetical protein [Deltaproteobacteria bacterium]
MIREMDADLREIEVHRPLRFRSGIPHFGLDAVQQRREVGALGTLHHPLGGECPAGAGGHGVVGGQLRLAKTLPVGVLLTDIGTEPIRHKDLIR